MYACEGGNSEAVSLLLDKGADVNTKDKVSYSDQPYDGELFE